MGLILGLTGNFVEELLAGHDDRLLLHLRYQLLLLLLSLLELQFVLLLLQVVDVFGEFILVQGVVRWVGCASSRSALL